MKKGDGWLRALTLIGLSFLYGIFHAAGPGDGKAVIFLLCRRQPDGRCGAV
jgi:ABC-type nickel/cobalt efflux system permease component RcnA